MRSTRLRRGRIRHHDIADSPILDWPHDRWLRDRFGLTEDSHPDAADALALLTGARPEGALVARPVNLHVGLDHPMLMPPHVVGLSQAAAADLRDAANRHFGDDGPRFEVLAPGCWLLVPPRPLALRTRSASMAAGRDIRDHLPEGPDARLLAAWINELQMVWHGHAANESRESAGHLPVNWLWVEGPLPAPDRCVFASVHSDRPNLRALAEAAGVTEVTATPRAAAELGELFDAQPRLIELSCWRRPVLEGDAAGWRDAWSAFTELVAPALRGAARKARVEFILTGEHSSVSLEWSARDRWKWWRAADRGPREAAGR